MANNVPNIIRRYSVSELLCKSLSLLWSYLSKLRASKPTQPTGLTTNLNTLKLVANITFRFIKSRFITCIFIFSFNYYFCELISFLQVLWLNYFTHEQHLTKKSNLIWKLRIHVILYICYDQRKDQNLKHKFFSPPQIR